MNRLEEFRAAIHEAGERSEVPSLAAILERNSPPTLQWRWAVAASLIVALGAVPMYRDAQQRQREIADALLMDKVNAALSRPVPRALAPLMGN